MMTGKNNQIHLGLHETNRGLIFSKSATGCSDSVLELYDTVIITYSYIHLTYRVTWTNMHAVKCQEITTKKTC